MLYLYSNSEEILYSLLIYSYLAALESTVVVVVAVVVVVVCPLKSFRNVVVDVNDIWERKWKEHCCSMH